MSALDQVSTWVTANVAAEDTPVFALSEHDIPVTNTDSFSASVLSLSLNLMFSPSPFTQVYIIIYSTLPDCFKMTPTGTACLTMAVLHALPKTRIAFTAQDPAEYGCHLTVSFYNEWEQNAVVERNWGQHTDDFGPGWCVRWRGARCVSLWLVSYVAQAESAAVYSSWNRGKMQSWPYSSPQNHIKTHTHTHTHTRTHTHTHCDTVGLRGICVCLYTCTTCKTCYYTHPDTHCNYIQWRTPPARHTLNSHV